MLTRRHLLAWSFVLIGVGACAPLKPEDRIRPGTPLAEVERIAGPPEVSSWTYTWGNETVLVQFTGEYVHYWMRTIRDANSEEFQAISSYKPYALERYRYKLNEAGALLGSGQVLPPWPQPVSLGDSRAQVLKLYGTPPEMSSSFANWPVSGDFKDGKLVKWNPPLPLTF